MIQKLSAESKELLSENSKKDQDLKAKSELVSEKVYFLFLLCKMGFFLCATLFPLPLAF